MKYLKLTVSLVVFLVLTCYFSWLLLRSPVEFWLEYRTGRPVEINLYPSEPMDRKIGKKAFPMRLNSSPKTGEVSCSYVRFPLSCLRKFRLELPPGSDFELSGAGCRVLGLFTHPMSKRDLCSGRGTKGLEITRVLIPESDVPSCLKFHTGKTGGSCEFRLVNDLPRFLALFFGVLGAAGIAALIFWILNSGIRRIQGKYLLTGMFLLLLYGGTVVSAVISAPDAEAVNKNKPVLNLLEITRYPERFSKWYRRHLPFRNQIFSLYYKFCCKIGITPVKDVFAGRDGWLFIGRFSAQAPYEDYLGVNLFSEDQLRTILDRILFIQRELKKRNIRFCIFIAPGKIPVYDDMLREEYRRKDASHLTRARQLVDYIRKHSTIPIEYPLDDLLAARRKMSVPLYYKYDTHWNFLGAYIGARSMMRMIDPKAAERMPDISALEYFTEGMRYGDLTRMIEAPETRVEPERKFRHPAFHYRFFAGDSGCYSLVCKRKNGKRVFFIRDSFLAHMMPYLAGQLSHTTLYWDFTLNFSMIEKDRPDIVVLEMVDRYLAALLSFEETSWHMQRGGKLL